MEKLFKQLLGNRKDWRIETPYLRVPQAQFLKYFGPVVVLGSSFWLSWLVFNGGGPNGDANANGLFEGTLAILFMAWSFILAVRLRFIESFFGGLDSMYRLHRWIGALAIPLMFLHSELADVSNGFIWANGGTADSAEDLAGTAMTLLLILVGVSLLRWIPYKYWKFSHKLIGIPYVFASWHVYTAEKPVSNESVVGIALVVLMGLGVAAYAYRVLVKDVFLKGLRYKIIEANKHRDVIELVMRPVGKALTYKAGQFVAMKIEKRGLSEPHVFTIAEPPETGDLRFFIKDLGDWTKKLHSADLEGETVYIEGPYGRFHAYKKDKQNVWVAGGVGITPFLSVSSSLPKNSKKPPVLFFCVRSLEDAMGLKILQKAHDEGRIELKMVVSSHGDRFSMDMLEKRFDKEGLKGAHLAMCGPKPLLQVAEKSARKMQAKSIDSEDFDFRQGFGPNIEWDLSKIVTSG